MLAWKSTGLQEVLHSFIGAKVCLTRKSGNASSEGQLSLSCSSQKDIELIVRSNTIKFPNNAYLPKA